MAPLRTKKRKSSTESDAPARPQTVAIKSPTRTPTRSPQKRAMGITEGQKQALIDNLQLEITERARKLRAQYALQAQSLRTRIELRINRIPTSLRKANMGELLQKYQELSQTKPVSTTEEPQALEPQALEPARSSVLPRKTTEVFSETKPASVAQTTGRKRNSDLMDCTDKENTSEPTHDIPNPKKRTKVAKGPSRQVTNPSTVLSPKSANSRTFPQSPIRPVLGSPQKPYMSRPASPLKPISPVKVLSPAKAAAAAATASLASMVGEKPKAGRPKAGTGRKASNLTGTAKGPGARTKRGAQAAQEPEDLRKVSNTSNISSASTGTTIVKSGKKVPTATGKRNDIGVRAVGKKVTAAAEAPAAGRRILRKRA